MTFHHKPVLLEEAIDALNIRPDGLYVDATLGGGGHAQELLKRTSLKAQLLGIDRDSEAIFFTKNKLSEFGPRFRALKGNYRDIKKLLYDAGVNQVDGILLDLGVSSFQLDTERRGFSFHGSAPLDMRMDSEQKLRAQDLLNTLPKEELEAIIKEYGDEPKARKIAEQIVKYREQKPLETTDELANIVESVYRGRRGKTHPATKTFQAIRIAVNDELGGLKDFLPQAIQLLNKGGRLAIISFHSLEDAIVKRFFKELTGKREKLNKYGAKPQSVNFYKLITNKPITPTADEIGANPRARSAKLRILEKTHDTPNHITQADT
jgi:16S rRNA (cytosine1402-N4)-methyltransferase